ncbi:MAG: TetR family transcriptional regulator [Rhizorhabdus sp.]
MLDAAETLFGERSVEAVSMREIAVAAGTSNHFAVQHYFNTKDELIRAIFRRRAVSLEEKRAARLLTLQHSDGRYSASNLLEALFRPVIEEVDRHGNRSYAHFLLGVMWAQPYMQLRDEMNELFPTSNRLMTLLVQALPHLSQDLFAARISASATLFLQASLHWDHGGGNWRSAYADFDEAVNDALAMAVAALEAPVG